MASLKADNLESGSTTEAVEPYVIKESSGFSSDSADVPVVNGKCSTSRPKCDLVASL